MAITHPVAALPRWLGLCLAALVSLALVAVGPPVQARAAQPFAIGMYNTGTPWSFTSFDSYESQLGLHMAIVHWYQAWGAADVNASAYDPSLLSAVDAHGSVPFITWEPWDETLPVTQQTFPLRSIAAGQFDSYIDSWASGLRAFHKPVLLTFAQEMQGNWYPWGYGVNGNSAADYISAYRHVHDRFAAAGATNVEWVWTVDADDSGSPYPASTTFYPGDGYTDWMGVDAYNRGTSQSWSSWQSLSDVLGLTYQRLTQLNSSKPIVLSEWASVEAGGSKAAWLAQAADSLQQSYPRVEAAVWFNEHGTAWALDTSSTALTAAGTAFRQLATPGCIGPGSTSTSWSNTGSGTIVRSGVATCLLNAPQVSAASSRTGTAAPAVAAAAVPAPTVAPPPPTAQSAPPPAPAPPPPSGPIAPAGLAAPTTAPPARADSVPLGGGLVAGPEVTSPSKDSPRPSSARGGMASRSATEGLWRWITSAAAPISALLSSFQRR